MQYSGEKNQISNEDLNYFYTLSDCYNNYEYFKFEKQPLSLQKDEIINLKEISYIYDSKKQFFYLIVNLYEIKSKALYQIYPYTSAFNINAYLNIFIYIKKKSIDYLNFNVLSNLATLPKKLSFYVRVISKITLTSFTKNKNNTHDGNFFYFDIIDINNDTVRVIATYSNANFYYNKIKINSIYIISGNFYLNEITKYQEHNRDNPLYKFYKEIKIPSKEIYIGNDSKIKEMDSNDDNLIKIDENKFLQFNNIGNILKLNNTFVDLVNTIGIVIKSAKCYKITYAIRKIKLLDDSGFIIDVNLWNQYTLYPVKLGDILMIKNIQVKKDNKGVNFMTTVDETDLIINPDVEKVELLKQIYKTYQEKFKNKSLANKNNDNNCILKYVNYYNNNITFIKDLINIKSNNSNFSFIKYIYGYIQKIICTKLDDIISYICISCEHKLKQKGVFWFCSNCKKNYICPNFSYKNLIVNIIDSTGNINVLIDKKKVRDIFGISADKIKQLEEIKNIENKIKYKLCAIYTLNNYDINGNLISEDFNFISYDKIKEFNLSEIKKYINNN